MTTLDKQMVKCICCNVPSSQTIVMSTNRFGSPDLDLRPPEMERSILPYQVQRCPNCGYCAYSIDEDDGVDFDKELLMLDEYKKLINNSRYPELTNSFLALAFIKIHSDILSESFWCTIRAAWVCDDNFISAVELRKQALDLLDRIDSMDISNQVGLKEILRIDTLRRIGKFNQAKDDILQIQKIECDKIINSLIEIENVLINNKDAKAHSFSEFEDK